MFSQLHSAEEIQRYCQVKDAVTNWNNVRQTLESKINRVHEIELLLASGSQTNRSQIEVSELWQLYHWTFNAFKYKGVAEQRLADKSFQLTASRGQHPTAENAYADVVA